MDVRLRSTGGSETTPKKSSLSSSRPTPSSNSTASLVPTLIGIGILSFVIIGCVRLFVGGNNWTTTAELDTVTVQADELQQRLKFFREENEELKHQIEIAKKQQQQQQQAPEKGGKNNNEDTTKTLTRLRDYKQRMHDEIQRISKRELLHKYGAGPHILEVSVEFDPQSNIYTAEKSGGTIKIEMAPVDEMPATVFHFLEQVSSGLMNGCSFHRNAEHVLQAGAAPNFKIQPPRKDKDFAKANLLSVPFQEYSPNFPHVKYTLGYAGRPGGPDFYVSTLDNTENHGPGGQGSYEDASEADPCFAKVIDGFDIVDLMHKSAIQPGDYNAMKHNIVINEIKLIKQ